MNFNLNQSYFFNYFFSELKKPKIYILLFFATIYCLISLVNHYNYRTYAFDLGIYNNCLYQYGHFHKNHYPYLHYMFTNFLADHFSLYTVILSPLYYIFGTPTLLYVQILSVLFGAVGIYKFVKLKFDTPFLPEIAMVHYLAFFGIYSALAFDYHDNVVSAMLVSWFIYYFDKGNKKLTILFAILIVIGKENMPIWLAFVCLGLAWLHYKEKSKRNFALVLSLSSIVYVLLIIKVIMPALDPVMAKNGYHAFQYSILGENTQDVLKNLIHDPLKIFKALFVSHQEWSELKYIKLELYICLLASGGIMMLFKPQYIVMLIPIIAQKVFSNDYGKWGISCHYSIEFTGIVVIAFYDGLHSFKKQKMVLYLAIIGALSTIYTTYSRLENRQSRDYNKLNGCFYLKGHYKCEFKKSEVKRVMAMIPADANLSSLSPFAPHLSFRKNIYQFPDVYDAEYIFIAVTESSFPISGPELKMRIREYQQSPEWETLSANKGIFLFKKK